ncbi:uncharacterized protein N7483_012790 [Penicillium malachiteum]|uniref:uncharacterized protein n=1 Tax=Penicillium malachiteum TaxID=1324776 RepID=UPI0025491224|nr:uncharacterized protein N7483_012790 [Penicillium malachiteum]KAJ5715609.1 hypothetical protein N7483_012790 [Penicillium malachiteum]
MPNESLNTTPHVICTEIMMPDDHDKSANHAHLMTFTRFDREGIPIADSSVSTTLLPHRYSYAQGCSNMTIGMSPTYQGLSGQPQTPSTIHSFGPTDTVTHPYWAATSDYLPALPLSADELCRTLINDLAVNLDSEWSAPFECAGVIVPSLLSHHGLDGQPRTLNTIPHIGQIDIPSQATWAAASDNLGAPCIVAGGRDSAVNAPFPEILMSPGQCRFIVTLHTPTALVPHPTETPITYLDKEQRYVLSIVDRALSGEIVGPRPVRYRTQIWASLEDNDHESASTGLWQSWKEEYGGSMAAIECLSAQAAVKSGHVEVERNFLNGFCITWSSDGTTSPLGCSMGVRFNFRSTDFVQARGAKSPVVRLYAETEALWAPEEARIDRLVEQSYCKVQIFRKYGTKRKSAKDIFRVQEAIRQVEYRLLQAGTGDEEYRTNIALMASCDQGRRWEDEQHARLAMLQVTLTSSHSKSVFRPL